MSFLVIVSLFRITDRSLARLGPRNCDGPPLNINDCPQSSVAGHGRPELRPPGGQGTRHKIWASGRSTHMTHQLRASVHVLFCLPPACPTWTHTCPHKSPRPIALGPIYIGGDSHFLHTCTGPATLGPACQVPTRAFCVGPAILTTCQPAKWTNPLSMPNLRSTCQF